MAIKKAISYYKRGDVALSKKALNKLKQRVPKNSQLYNMIELGAKEIKKRVYIDYVVPGIERILNYLEEKRFNQAKGHLLMLQRIMPVPKYNELKGKIKQSEKAHYLGLGKNNFDEKKYDKALELVRIVAGIYPKDKEIQTILTLYKETKLRSELQAAAYNNLRQGNINYDKKNYTRALFYYRGYIDMVKKDPEIQKRISFIEKYLEEQKRRKYFYTNYNRALRLIKSENYERALSLLNLIKNYPYEKEALLKNLTMVQKELERIRYETAQEIKARNYLAEGKQRLERENYKEALDSFLLAMSVLEELRKRNNLKLEARHFIQKTRAILKEIEAKKARERLRKINRGIKRGRREYFLGNYQKSILYLREVVELDAENLVAKDYLALAEEALQVESVGKVLPRDPFYSMFIALKTEGESLQKKGRILIQKGQKTQGQKLLNQSLDKWQTIKRAFPYNQEARLNIRAIFKYLDQKGWRETIKEDLERALRLAKSGNKKAAYKLVQEIYKEAPRFPRIQYYLRSTKPKEKPKRLTPGEKKQAIKLYNQALSLFTRRNYRQAMKRTVQIMNINRYVKDGIIERGKSLYLKIKNKLEADKLRSVNLSMKSIIQRTRFYRKALNFYQKKNYKKAIEFAKKALKIDSSYNSARSLLESSRKRLKL